MLLQLEFGEFLQNLGIFRVGIGKPLENPLGAGEFAMTDKELGIDEADFRLLFAELESCGIAVLRKLEAAGDLMSLAEQKRRAHGLRLLAHGGTEVGNRRIDHAFVDLDGTNEN